MFNKLKQYFAPKGATFPKKEWVRHALDAFVTIGRAMKNKDNSYTVFFRRTPQGKVLQTFAEEWIEKSTNRTLTEFMQTRPDDQTTI